MRLDRARKIAVEYEDGEAVTLHARRVGWSYGVEWAEQWADAEDDPRARIDLCVSALIDHITAIDDVEDDGGKVEWPDDDEAARELIESLFTPSQLVEVATHVVYEDSAGKSLRSVATV